MNIYTLIQFKDHEYNQTIRSYKSKIEAIRQIAYFAKERSIPLPQPKNYYDGFTSVYNFGGGLWYQIEQNQLL